MQTAARIAKQRRRDYKANIKESEVAPKPNALLSRFGKDLMLCKVIVHKFESNYIDYIKRA